MSASSRRTMRNLRNRLAPEHVIPRYHAFSTPEEQAAYIDDTVPSPAILPYAVNSSPTLTEISLAREIIIRPLEEDGDVYDQGTSSNQQKTAEEHVLERIGRLIAMLTLYNLARSCEEIGEKDWEEYITPYEEGDLEMLERVCPKKWWDKEIREAWPNLIVFARRARRHPS
ncbi:uncharacterized protein J4E78_006032 [Alternaria triticimaculans]|uniref:uncharacterized protein n=1 Tax=Alternaria triticimaculans TaxID=297637 RepID=UPI0020C21DB3|nr:uncharacterized protein J4E78_006032 [Alternaria triticimaculans]KAI4657644.1 hypothetical protein J4E78_006032 [Alternaria triticimaculans]